MVKIDAMHKNNSLDDVLDDVFGIMGNGVELVWKINKYPFMLEPKAREIPKLET